MEPRNITVVTTRDQKKTVVSTDATTLAELKSALSAVGINYEGMTFYEGLSHTELLSDDSVLPHDVPYKGETTNELVFMLTNTNKKIKSGVISAARQAFYTAITERNLVDACRQKYGRAFTNCSNAELMALINENEVVETEPSCSAKKAVEVLTNILYDSHYLRGTEKDAVLRALDGESSLVSPYSDDEVSEMFAGIQ